MRENKEWAFLYGACFLATFITALMFFLTAMTTRDSYRLLLAQNTPGQDNTSAVLSAIQAMKSSYKTMFLCFWLLFSFSLIALFFFILSISSTNKEEDYEVQKLNLEMSRLKRKQKGRDRRAETRQAKRNSRIERLKED